MELHSAAHTHPTARATSLLCSSRAPRLKLLPHRPRAYFLRRNERNRKGKEPGTCSPRASLGPMHSQHTRTPQRVGNTRREGRCFARLQGLFPRSPSPARGRAPGQPPLVQRCRYLRQEDVVSGRQRHARVFGLAAGGSGAPQVVRRSIRFCALERSRTRRTVFTRKASPSAAAPASATPLSAEGTEKHRHGGGVSWRATRLRVASECAQDQRTGNR